MIPSGYKEDTVYSVVPSDGSGDLSFTRASNGTRVNSAGLVEVCPWNLVSQSENIGTSPWLLNGATLTSGQTDPSGGTTAVKVQLASGGNNYVYQGIPFPNPINIVSAYLRADSATTIGFSMGGSTPNTVNLTTTWQLFTFSSADTSGGIIFDNYFGPSPTQQAKTFYIWHPQLNIGATAKPYFPTTDRLNVPRLTYQNGGGGCPSLLLEKQSTNLFTYSEDFSNVDWLNEDIIVSTNQTISPDGTQNADKLIANTTTLDHSIYQTSAGSTKTFSIYAKAAEYNYIFLGSNNNGASDGAFFNLSNGTISQNTSGLTASIESVGNGWYRCIVSSTSWPTIYSIISLSTNGTSLIFTGNNTSGIYAWGCQVENSSYVTSYIATQASSATRVADVAVKSSISSLFGASATSLFMDFEITQVSNDATWTVTGYDGSNLFSLCQFSATTNFPRIVFDGGVDTTLGTALSIGRHKIAVSFATNDFRAYIDGVLVHTDTSCTYNRYDRIAVNGTAWTGNTNNNNSFKLNQYAQFPNVLTNAQLASLTTI